MRGALVCCAVLAAACGGDGSGPTAPTDTVRLTGTWAGSFEGQVISSRRLSAELEQSDGIHGERTNVTGSWNATVRLPPVPGVPAEVELGGSVRGNATGSTADLTFEIDGFRDYFPEGCAILVDVSSFDATRLTGTWRTSDECRAPAVDLGTLTMTRQ